MTVKKVKGGYALFSKTSGRKLSGTFKSKSAPGLKKREKQVQFFKNNKKYKANHGGRSIPRKKK